MHRPPRPILLGGLIIALVAVGCAVTRQATEADERRDQELVERGEYLVTVLSCAHCHTPHDEQGNEISELELTGHPADAPLPEWDPSLMERNILVGIGPTLTAFAGPFGVSVAGNLTPHPESGIGSLTADEMIEAWRTQIHWREDRPTLPPMPVGEFKHLTDDDIRAIHAYLHSLPPHPNQPPKSQPAPPPG